MEWSRFVTHVNTWSEKKNNPFSVKINFVSRATRNLSFEETDIFVYRDAI